MEYRGFRFPSWEEVQQRDPGTPEYVIGSSYRIDIKGIDLHLYVSENMTNIEYEEKVQKFIDQRLAMKG